jgi:hypothetical protein
MDSLSLDNDTIGAEWDPFSILYGFWLPFVNSIRLDLDSDSVDWCPFWTLYGYQKLGQIQYVLNGL